MQKLNCSINSRYLRIIAQEHTLQNVPREIKPEQKPQVQNSPVSAEEARFAKQQEPASQSSCTLIILMQESSP